MCELLRKRWLLIFVGALLIGSAWAEDRPFEEAVTDNIPEHDCVIEPSEIVDVGSAVPGVLEAIDARRSDFVEKGEVIAALESSVEQATVVLSKARAALNTSIELRQESAAFGRRSLKRNQELFHKSSISKQEIDRLKTEARVAELQVLQEQDNKRIAELEYQRALASLRRRTISSPVDGVVMERFKSVGEYVEDDPILRVAQLDPLHVEVIMPVEYLGQITTGMRARVEPSIPGHGTHEATVTRVDRVADAASATFGVRLSLPNRDYAIPSGLRCRLDFLSGEDKETDETVGYQLPE